MSNYRDILYRDYSSAFGEQKTYDASTQHAQYDASYKGLPSRKDVAIADLGCGKGEWLGWLQAKGYSNLTGVDLSPSDLGFARQQRPSGTWIEQNVIDFLDAHPASFDLLHAKDIVEHFTKDEFLRFLTAAKNALKPGGELWLLTFNAQSPLASATRYGDLTHELGLTPGSMAQGMRACGFTRISVQGRHYCSTARSGKMRRLLGKVIYHFARLMLKVRHGTVGTSHEIDFLCAEPDLFGRGGIA
jgi:cyclopropane fatty-acyl-phospholipid synthase-like methyltransferase